MTTVTAYPQKYLIDSAHWQKMDCQARSEETLHSPFQCPFCRVKFD